MQTRTSTLIGFIGGALMAVVLTIGAFAGAGALRPSTAQAQSNGIVGMRQITVIGSGDSRVTPDMATVQLGVETTAPTTKEAMAQNSTQAQAIIDQLKQLGVAEKDIQTSGFNIYATYGTDGREVTGYTVSNMVSVTVRNLGQAGDLLDKVVQAGANRVYGINFSVSDPAGAQSQARAAAMANAKARAQELAQAGGANLGQVLVITESIGSPPPIMMPAAMAERSDVANAAPVQAGEQTINAQVQVTFELR